MKHLIMILLLGYIPILSTAQTLSEAQKQEALQCATKFCNLLERYCNGERTLMTQITALCSGEDFSAYDDIKTNKETSIRNYLYTIQGKYPDTLATNLSTPSFADCEIYNDYDFSLSVNYGTITGSQYQTTILPSIEHNNLLNVMIIFNVKQEYPTLNKSITKKLIYSSKTKKITAFVHYNSAIISYSKGLDAFTMQKYENAISYFENAIKIGGKKFTRKRDCYIGMYVASYFILDFDSALKYAELIGDIGYILSTKGMIAILNEQPKEAINYYKQLENRLSHGEKSLYPLSCVHFMLGMSCMMPQSEPAHQASAMSVYYLKKCVASNDEISVLAAYMIYIAWISHQVNNSIGINENDMTYSEALSYLRMAAEKDYSPAFLLLAMAEHFDVKDKEEAVKWYQKSAEQGNAKAMALLGKVLLTEPEFSSRKAEGIKWLKKSLAGNELEIAIKDFDENIPRSVWPGSRADVEALLDVQNTTSSHPSTPSTTTPVTTNTPSVHTNNNHSSSTPSHTYHYREPFNSPGYDYPIAGISVGYVQKNWSYKTSDGESDSFGYWEDSNHINGIQAGIRVEPQFKYGFAINTGLYYEYYFSNTNNTTIMDEYDNEIRCKGKLQEHNLYLPIHLEYRLHFTDNFKVFINCGLGFDYGLGGSIKYTDIPGYEDTSFDDIYKQGWAWKRFNTSLEYGAGIYLFGLQLHVTAAKGLVNMSEEENVKVKMNKNLSIGMSYMF